MSVQGAGGAARPLHTHSPCWARSYTRGGGDCYCSPETLSRQSCACQVCVSGRDCPVQTGEGKGSNQGTGRTEGNLMTRPQEHWAQSLQEHVNTWALFLECC